MKTLKRIRRLLWILFTKKITTDELVDLWLIPLFNTTCKEQEPLYKTEDGFDTRGFYNDHKVTWWQEKIWLFFARRAVLRVNTKWYNESWRDIILFSRYAPFISLNRYKPSKKYMRRGEWSWYLNSAPNIKHRK